MKSLVIRDGWLPGNVHGTGVINQIRSVVVICLEHAGALLFLYAENNQKLRLSLAIAFFCLSYIVCRCLVLGCLFGQGAVAYKQTVFC